MGTSTTVMPISLRILKYDAAYGELKMFSATGEQMIDARDDGRFVIGDQEFTTTMFCDVISMNSNEDVEAFMQKHPRLRLLTTGKILSFNDYSKSVIQAIQLYRLSAELSDAFKAYDAEPTAMNLLAVFELSIMIAAPENHDRELSDLKRRIEQDHLRISDGDLELIRSRLYHHINKMLSPNRLSFHVDNSTIIYVCPTVKSAMYMHHFLDFFNRNEYRVCKHPSCNKFFLVDRHHPQSMCPEHMLARQKKRAKQKQKEREEEALSWDFVKDD